MHVFEGVWVCGIEAQSILIGLAHLGHVIKGKQGVTEVVVRISPRGVKSNSILEVQLGARDVDLFAPKGIAYVLLRYLAVGVQGEGDLEMLQPELQIRIDDERAQRPMGLLEIGRQAHRFLVELPAPLPLLESPLGLCGVRILGLGERLRHALARDVG
jgi:hypothetical protein